MKSLIFALTLLFSINAIAVTDNKDGSVTLTQQEAEAILENIQKMEAKNNQAEKDQQSAIDVLIKMQKQIEMLESLKCS